MVLTLKPAYEVYQNTFYRFPILIAFVSFLCPLFFALMNVVLIKYNAGNTQSVVYALERLGISPTITDEIERIKAADKVIFPGVGEARTAMQYLKHRKLDRLIIDLRQPVLGICIGLQLLCTHSEENNTKGLGIFPNKVKRFPHSVLKVPHIGWNTLHNLQTPLFSGITEGEFTYFVHTYCADVNQYTAAQTHYGVNFSAALCKENFYAVQFHTEKSSKTGAKILQNFIAL